MTKSPSSTPGKAPQGSSTLAVSPRSKLTSTLIMLTLTAIMLPLLFPPFYCFFLAPVALVPFVICILRRPFNWKYFGAYYLLGAAFFIPNLYWLIPVTIGGYIALALYVAIYFPLFAFGTHRLIIHLRLPATLAVPLVWTAVEFVRCSFLEGGFPWFMLGSCLTPIPTLIQSADLFGVWGLSFLIAMINGFIVDLLRLPLTAPGTTADPKRKKDINPVLHRLANTVVVTLILVSGYGIFRMNQRTTTPGPLVAVIQENIPQEVKESHNAAPDIWNRHLLLTGQAFLAQPDLDLLIWPETMIPGLCNSEFINASPEEIRRLGGNFDLLRDFQRESGYYIQSLKKLSTNHHIPLLVGYGSLEPRGSFADSPTQNRTALILPDKGVVDEYAKVHLVPVGEYIPFGQWPWLKNLLREFIPVDNTPGTRWTRFALPLQPPASAPATLTTLPVESRTPNSEQRIFTFGTLICFEGVMPYPARDMAAPSPREPAGSQKADFLINVSNEGWFRSIELDQNLQATQIRAVENRIPIARSVNAGNSGFIDSNGRIVKLVTDSNGRSIHAVGFAVHGLDIDSRHTLYTRIGDIFPILCGILSTLAVGWTLVRPRRGTPREP